jgi:hypothetical protein
MGHAIELVGEERHMLVGFRRENAISLVRNRQKRTKQDDWGSSEQRKLLTRALRNELS